jgi:hypothetical protein
MTPLMRSKEIHAAGSGMCSLGAAAYFGHRHAFTTGVPACQVCPPPEFTKGLVMFKEAYANPEVLQGLNRISGSFVSYRL